ncbi:MAG: DUF4157 domain-containing protein, partial [Prochloraceae cyanobacterium]|nr:DUF4157 domain-containing protein [Prochloraceae cyanobacterium]
MYRQQISRKTSPSFNRTNVSNNLAPSPSYEPLSSVVQRAQQDPENLSLKERQQLEIAIGTRATREILAGEQASWIPEFKGISAQLGQDSGHLDEPIQAKLTVGQPDDKYEQEADRVADQIMQMPDPEVMAEAQSSTSLEIQRLNQNSDEELHRQPEEDLEEQFRIEEEEEEKTIQAKEQPGQTPQVTPSLEARLAASRGQGEPLPEETRGFMESRFRKDFSSVRIHTGSEAAQLSRELKAQAFTHGQDVYFGAGKYSPESVEGKRLLAHELTHVVQQKYTTNQYQLQSLPVETRVQAKPQESLPQKGSSPKNSPWNRVWIGLPGIIGEVVEAGITVRIFKSYKELGVRQKPEDRAYACGRYNVSAIQTVVNKMKLIAQKVAYFNKKILKSKMQTTLVLIDPGAAETGFRLSKGKGLIILNQKDFNKGAYLDYIAHEASHAIFSPHGEDYKKPSQRVPDSLALHIANLYVQLKNTKRVPIPSTKFTKQKPPLKVKVKDIGETEPVGLVMVMDTLWSGQGGHPWHGVDEFFASAYAGFLQQPKLLHQIVNHYKKTEPAIKPLANKLFKLLKMVGKPGELKKLNKPSQSQAVQKELTGTGTIPRLDEIIGVHPYLLWLDNPSKMPLGSQSCPSKLPQKSSQIPVELQLSSISGTTDTTLQMLAEQTLVADRVKHAVQRHSFSEGSTLIQRSGAVKQKKRITSVTPYYVSFVNAKIPEKPNHSFSFSSRKGANRAGLTQVKVQKKLKFFWDRGAARPDGKVPFFARSVNIFFRLDPIEIYVSSDYAEGSCPYRATLEHEKEHVKSFIKIFHSYRDKFIKKIYSISFPTEASPLWSDPGNLSTIQTSLEKLVVQAIKDIANELNADMRKDRAAKDSPSAYEAVHTQCPP